MLAQELDFFRKNKKITVRDFCEITGIPAAQYNRYRSGSAAQLQINDAAKLLAGFPDDISIPVLCRMCEIKTPKLSAGFPQFSFAVPNGFYKSNKRIRKFIVDTLQSKFSPSAAGAVLDAVTTDVDIFSDDVIRQNSIPFFITQSSQYSLMQALKSIGNLKTEDISLDSSTVNFHFMRRNRIQKFSDLCIYERTFDSYGIFLLMEMLFSTNRSGINIFARSQYD